MADIEVQDLVRALAVNRIHAADCAQLNNSMELCSCWVDLPQNGGVIHALMDAKTGHFPCCGKTLEQAGSDDRVNLVPAGRVTCPGVQP